jgi:hypothetical protein
MFLSGEIVSMAAGQGVSFRTHHETDHSDVGVSLSRSHFLPIQQVKGQSNPAEKNGTTGRKVMSRRKSTDFRERPHAVLRDSS